MWGMEMRSQKVLFNQKMEALDGMEFFAIFLV